MKAILKLERRFFVFAVNLILCVMNVYSQKILLLEESFEGGMPEIEKKWQIQGDIDIHQGYVATQISQEKPLSALKSKAQFSLPYIRNGDNYYLRLEWSVRPIQVGSIDYPVDINDFKWGSELRMMGGWYHSENIQVQVPFIVGLDKNKVYLNTTHEFSQPQADAGWLHMAIEFTADGILGFSINHQEMLTDSIACYKDGPAQEFHIRLSDYLATQSKTHFGPIRLYKVIPEDTLRWKIKTWKFRNDGVKKEAVDYIYSAVSPLKKLFREPQVFKEPITHFYSTYSAQNEYESFQVAILPVKQPLKNVRLTMTDMIHTSSDYRISASHITWNIVDYIETKDAYTRGDKVGWEWPDPLLPSDAVDISCGYLQPFWITFYIPSGVPSGKYQGIVQIDAEGMKPQEVLFQVDVWAFELPKTSSLFTAFSFCPQTWLLWHKPDEVTKLLPDENKRGRFEHLMYINREMLNLLPKEKWREIYDFLLARRITPTYYYQLVTGQDEIIWPFPEDWQYCADRGMNNLCLANINIDWDPDYCWWASSFKNNKAAYKQALLNRIDKFLNLSKNLKWNGLVYIYGFDESDMQKDHEKVYDPAIQEFFGLIKETYPHLGRASANPIHQKHFGYFNIWIPVTYQFDYDEAARRQALGEQVWCYVCCGPGKPMSNFFVDYPALEHRILFWELSRARITGLLYWAMNYYVAEQNWNKPGPRWPQVAWNGHTFNSNGDGILIYPGPNATPLSSIRLETIRDGIEDYDYYAILERLIVRINSEQPSFPESLKEQAKLLSKIPEDISKSFSEHTQNTGRLIQQRIAVGNMIEIITQKLSLN